jgi:hypothetical protein
MCVDFSCNNPLVKKTRRVPALSVADFFGSQLITVARCASVLMESISWSFHIRGCSLYAIQVHAGCRMVAILVGIGVHCVTVYNA